MLHIRGVTAIELLVMTDRIDDRKGKADARDSSVSNRIVPTAVCRLAIESVVGPSDLPIPLLRGIQ